MRKKKAVKNTEIDSSDIVASVVKNKESKQSTRGVVLIAHGDPLYFQWAFTMAVSLKSHSENIRVSLITTSESMKYLESDEEIVFDSIIYCKHEQFNGIRGYDAFKMKLHLDELTPYDQTLYLDVDGIWNNDHSLKEFLDSLKGTTFHIANRGKTTSEEDHISRWTNLKAIEDLYKLTSFYDVSSEVIYFEKGTTVFKTARMFYNDLRIVAKPFGKGFPDEVFIMCALAKENITLKDSPWFPTYWQPHYFNDRIKAKSESEIRSFKILSLGGAFLTQNVQRLYLIMAGAAYYRMGINKTPYYPYSKSQKIIERRFL